MAKPTCTSTYSPDFVSGRYSRQASRVMPPNCTFAMRSPPWSYVSTTLPGIARHIGSPRSFRLPQKFVGDDRLPQRDPTVVRRNQGVLEDRKATTPQLHYRTLQKVKVLEGAAAEANAVQPVALPDAFAQLDHGCG